MFGSSLTSEEQKNLSKWICAFLSDYGFLLDSYIIEFFTENLWATLPSSWQGALQDLTYPQVADLLLDSAHGDRRYPSVWPLSLLAFRTTAHTLAFPRACPGQKNPRACPGQNPRACPGQKNPRASPGQKNPRACPGQNPRASPGQKNPAGSGSGSVKPQEFLQNQSQSSLLDHVFRKHVKAKKQHEIHKLGTLVKDLCLQTSCSRVVDVGSGQGHLSRFLSFGMDLSVTAVEADPALVAMATRFDGQLLWTLEKERKKSASCSQLPGPDSAPHHVTAWVNPKASWEVFLQQLKAPVTQDSQDLVPGSQDCLSEARLDPSDLNGPEQTALQCEDQDFVLTGLHACGDLSVALLRHFARGPCVRAITSVACCYMKISTRENPAPPGRLEELHPGAFAPGQDSSVPSEFGYPMSFWVRGLPGHELSYKAREGACHAIEDYVHRLRDQNQIQMLRSHCYRAILETFIRDTRPELRRAGIQTINKSHKLEFTEYARLGLARVGLPVDLVLDQDGVTGMLQQQHRVVVFFSLSLLLAPVVETMVLLDRIMFLQENGVDSQLVALFDPNFSPRNFVLVAVKPRPQEDT